MDILLLLLVFVGLSLLSQKQEVDIVKTTILPKASNLELIREPGAYTKILKEFNLI